MCKRANQKTCAHSYAKHQDSNDDIETPEHLALTLIELIEFARNLRHVCPLVRWLWYDVANVDHFFSRLLMTCLRFSPSAR